MSVILTGKEGKVIPISDAKEMHNNYSSLGVGIFSEEVKSLIFGKDQILSLLNQTACSGLRIYFGLKKIQNHFEPELLLVAINKNGEDIIDLGRILSDGVPCPKICPSAGF